MNKIKISNLKQYICIFVFVAVVSFSIFMIVPKSTNAASNTREYIKYNASTRNKISNTYNAPNPYTITASPSISNVRSVFGSDDRQIDNSKTGVVKLIGSSNYLGTGFVVDDHVIATAAHCIISNPNTIESIEGIFLFNSSGGFIESVDPVEVHVPKEYVEFLSNNNNNLYGEIYHWTYDYALITVENDLSSYKCFNLAVPLDTFFPSTASEVNEPLLKITGFPQVVGGELSNTKIMYNKYTGSGYAKYYTNIMTYYNPYHSLLYYDVDSSSGNSGSPIYYEENYGGRTYYSVIGIATADTYWTPYANSGVKMTDDLLSFYLGNSNINY